MKRRERNGPWDAYIPNEETVMVKIKDLKVNERENFEMLLKEVKEVQGSNGPFCVLTLIPEKGARQIEARKWKCTRDAVIAATPEMSPVNIWLAGNEYRGELGYIADAMAPSAVCSVDDFIQTAPVPMEKMTDFTKGLIEKSFLSHPAAAPAINLIDRFEKELAFWPGAMKVHHAYKGGLIYHMGTCAGVCKKIAPFISPDYVASLAENDGARLIGCANRILSKHADKEMASFAGTLLKAYHAEEHQKDAVKKVLLLILLERIAKHYRFLNEPLLFTAAALRGCSVFTDDPMAGIIGRPAADAQAVIEKGRCFITDQEPLRMLAHCMLVDDGNDRDAAIPEAFLINEAEKLACTAYENRGEGKADAACMTIAAAVHDIGKIEELSSNEYGVAEYKAEGNLFGHTQIGIRLLLEEAEKCSVAPGDMQDVLHCMASHHGKAEWGALVEPKTLEAKAVAAVDYIDSRLDIFDGVLSTMEEGGRDESARRYIGNAIYKPVV